MSRQPQNRAEREIAAAMLLIRPAISRVLDQADIPHSAVSVAAINLGVQVGVSVGPPAIVAKYLRDAADLIEATEGRAVAQWAKPN